MATLLQELIEQIRNPELRARIAEETNKLVKSKKFGIVFEEHLPECTPMYGIPIRKGSKVAKKKGYIDGICTVQKVDGDKVLCIERKTNKKKTLKLSEIVAVAEFGEPIYPYLEQINSLSNSPKSDLWHTLIEADNYHALQLLKYLYEGKVDCIYIDPPYNAEKRDWKYNNDYVDKTDVYRHSKWLSMMEKRLRIAKTLLSADGVMIIAIDDNELNTLGLLLRKLFPEYDLFCITVIQNPPGNQGENFGITNEFAYFLIPTKEEKGQQILSLEDRSNNPIVSSLRDLSGNSNMRTDAKNCFYPIYIKDGAIVGFGDVCDDAFHPSGMNITRDDGIIEVYPFDSNGKERKWTFARHTVESILGELSVEWNKSGKFYDIIRYKTATTYKSVWTKKAYNANAYGSRLINNILGEKRFEYPKSLYTVYECVKSVCLNKPDALILDFFAGSGTTLHAVNLLNAEDGGHRRCIMVTNNELSEKEARALRKEGLQPGDTEWEKLGIAQYVTWPRTVCSIKGRDVNGKPLKGNYGVTTEAYEKEKVQVASASKTGKPTKKTETVYKKKEIKLYPGLASLKKSAGFKANAVHFKLGFLDKTLIEIGRQFAELFPILWLKAGAIGECPSLGSGPLPSMKVLPKNRFAVLRLRKEYAQFKREVEKHPEIQTVYIVTNSKRSFDAMSEDFKGKDVYQIYEDYLENFSINIEKRI